MINAEEARKRYISNREYGIHTYFELRQYNRDARAKERLPVPSPQQIERLARMGVPDRATTREVQPTTGDIAWPAALQMRVFADEREQMEALFAARGDVDDGVATGTHALVKDCAEEMHAQLKVFVDDLDPTTYLDARKFLDTLVYESRFAAPTQNVARIGNVSDRR